MYDTRLARSILERLEEAFPQTLHLRDLKAALPDFGGAPTRDWLLAIQALCVRPALALTLSDVPCLGCLFIPTRCR